MPTCSHNNTCLIHIYKRFIQTVSYTYIVYTYKIKDTAVRQEIQYQIADAVYCIIMEKIVSHNRYYSP